MDLPSLTNVLNFFEAQFIEGRAALLSDTISIMHLMMLLEVVFAGLYWVLGSSADIRAIARKILVIGFFYWTITQYGDLLKWIVDGFLYAGQKAGSGSSVDFATLKDPAKVFMRGMELSKPASSKLLADIDSSYFGIPSVDAVMLMICILITVFSFAVMAIQVFITYLEYLLIATAGFILIPFGIFKPTAFLAERVFGAIISFGIKLMILALIIGVSDKFLQTVILPDTVKWQQAIELSVIALALAFLTLHAPAVAQSLLTGSPHLSLGTIAATTAGAGFIGAKAASSVGSAASGFKSSTLAAAGALHGGGAAAAASMGSLATETSFAGKAARAASKASMYAVGGLGGVVSAAAAETTGKSLYGSGGAPNGSRAYREKIGDPSVRPQYGSRGSRNEGIVGAVNAGRYAVSGYRALDEKKRTTKSEEQDSKQLDKERRVNSKPGQVPSEPQQKTDLGGKETV